MSAATSLSVAMRLDNFRCIFGDQSSLRMQEIPFRRPFSVTAQQFLDWEWLANAEGVSLLGGGRGYAPREILKSEACQSPGNAIKFTSCGVRRFLQILTKTVEKPRNYSPLKKLLHLLKLLHSGVKLFFGKDFK